MTTSSESPTANTNRQATPLTDRALSVIIPVAPDDESWRSLLPDLEAWNSAAEILIAATAPPTDPSDVPSGVTWLVLPPGRARQMNGAARQTQGEFLWFLHADSRVSPDGLAALDRSLQAAPDALHYFSLRFRSDGPRRMRLNELGVHFRSRVLGLPFGDQGFCLPRPQFERLGGFNETAPYGEDHLLVWAARRHGMRLRSVGATLETSARKYQQQGWTRTTLRHLLLTARQALPEALRSLKRRSRP